MTDKSIWMPFWAKTRAILRPDLDKTGSYCPILLIFNCEHVVTEFKIVSKFEVNRKKIATVKMLPKKKTK